MNMNINLAMILNKAVCPAFPGELWGAYEI
jgi:hypothetical protein